MEKGDDNHNHTIWKIRKKENDNDTNQNIEDNGIPHLVVYVIYIYMVFPNETI